MQVTDSASTFVAIVLGLGVFLTIVAIGWRSVQHRRILRMQGADGQDTIIVAREDDEVTSVATTAETAEAAPTRSAPAADAGAIDRAPDA